MFTENTPPLMSCFHHMSRDLIYAPLSKPPDQNKILLQVMAIRDRILVAYLYNFGRTVIGRHLPDVDGHCYHQLVHVAQTRVGHAQSSLPPLVERVKVAFSSIIGILVYTAMK